MKILQPATQRPHPGPALGGFVCAVLLLASAAVGADFHCGNPHEFIFTILKNDTELAKIFDELGSRPVVKVGEHGDFLARGGIVQLQTSDTVKILANLARARAAHLAIPKRMLDVASEVIKNGERRKIRRWP